MTRPNGNGGGEGTDFWNIVSGILIALGLLLYIVFLIIGKPKDCSALKDGFTFGRSSGTECTKDY